MMLLWTYKIVHGQDHREKLIKQNQDASEIMKSLDIIGCLLRPIFAKSAQYVTMKNKDINYTY